MGTMYPHRTVYDSNVHTYHSEVELHASRATRISYGFLRGAGLGLIILVLIILTFTFGPVLKEELKFAFQKTDNANQNSETHLANLPIAEHTIAIQNEAKSYGVDPHFSVVIPKIDAKANIIPNVSAVNQAEYTVALKQGIAHAAGTYFPGQGRNIYIFSHSTDFEFNVARYNAIFYLLRKLEVGDTIIVYFSDEKFVYSVEDKFVVDATDIKWLTEKTDSEVLYLQTCDPPGTTWKRLIVKAVPL